MRKCPGELKLLYAEVFGEERPSRRESEAPTESDEGPTLTADEVIALARNAGNGGKFRELFDEGDASDYGSKSEADLALCSMIAFYAGPHPELVEEVFGRSSLVREKWREREDYRQRRIEKAIEGQEEFYEPVLRSLNDYDRLAADYVAKKWKARDAAQRGADDGGPNDRSSTLFYWHGEWYAYTGTVYEKHGEEELKADLRRHLRDVFDRAHRAEMRSYERKRQQDPESKESPPSRKVINTQLMNNVVEALKAICILPERQEMPCWFGEAPFPAAESLVTRSGIVHLPTGNVVPTTPRLFTTDAVDYRFDPDAGCPQWREFLRQLWPEDTQSIRTLQEFMGYVATLDTSLQKMLVLIGPKRSGKGTIARILNGLLGSGNVVGQPLDALRGEFGLQPLLGTRLWTIGDARLSGRGSGMVTERLLSITGEDALTVNRKYLDPVTTQLKTRILFISNELPNLADASATLPSRMILLKLDKSWYGKEDPGLTDRLLEELPGILNWSIRGLKRLRKRGQFVQPESGRQSLELMQDLASPMSAFIRDCCIRESGARVPVKELYAAWGNWCTDMGREYHGTVQRFGRDFQAAAHGIRVIRPRRKGESKRERCYSGIRLRDEHKPWSR